MKKKIGFQKEKKDFIYYFNKKQQKQHGVTKIRFVNYNEKPKAFNLTQSGGGFNPHKKNIFPAYRVLIFLQAKYKKKIDFRIENSKKNSVRELKTKAIFQIAEVDFKRLVSSLGREIQDGESRIIEENVALYVDGIKTVKHNDSIDINKINLKNLSPDNHDKIITFIDDYIQSTDNLNNQKLIDLKKKLYIKGNKIDLEMVIQEFEKHLKKKTFTETEWQIFLHQKVFYFNSNYLKLIRETDVNFKAEGGAKKPDFVMIDMYGFLDVFEIKTPQTDIFAKRIDKSHDNYYLSVHTSKAISQIEKYILYLDQNVKNYEEYMKKKTSIPFSVLKPKAFIIIGSSAEFNSDKKAKDFRLLRRTFKNVEFITFDEMLANLKSLLSKFNQQ